jgi:tRNA wybutosine-synthesizing protein 2
VHANAKHVHACELNPDSVEALRRGLVANGVVDRCTVHSGDNQLSAPKLAGTCDRVHLGLIPSSELAWPLACDALRRDKPGMLHVHANVNRAQIDEWAERLKVELASLLGGTPAPSSPSLEAMHPDQRASWEAAAAAAAAARVKSHEDCGGSKCDERWTVEVLHVELVKWYAPKIRHVVADVRCTPPGVAKARPEPGQQPAGEGSSA